MNIQTEFKKAFQVAMLDEKTMHSVAADKKATNTAYIIVGIASLIMGSARMLFPQIHGMIMYRPDLFTALGTALLSFVLFIIANHLLAYLGRKLFKTKFTADEFIRVLGYGSIVRFLGLVPALAGLGGLWNLVILLIALRRVAKLEWIQVILLLILVGICMAVIGGIISTVFGGLMWY